MHMRPNQEARHVRYVTHSSSRNDSVAYQAAESHCRRDGAGHDDQTPDPEQREVRVDRHLRVRDSPSQAPPPFVACSFSIVAAIFGPLWPFR